MLQKIVKRFAEDGIKAETVTVVKINGVKCSGIIVHKEGFNIAPTIYAPSNYKDMEEDVLYAYFKNAYMAAVPSGDFDCEYFLNWERVKEKVLPILIGAERNRGTNLLTTPFVGDLLVAFVVEVESTEFGRGTVKITSEHAERWNVTVNEVFEVAKKNVVGTSKVSDIFSVMENIIARNGDMDIDLPPRDRNFMYVASNKEGVYGAGMLLDDSALNRFYDIIGSCFYILPSSVHELIFVPDMGEGSAEELLAMVEQVNAAEVPEQDVLSCEVYYYDGERISVVASSVQKSA